MTDENRATIRKALKAFDDENFHNGNDCTLSSTALALLDSEDKPSPRPVLNPEVLVMDIRAEGAPGKGRWKMSRKMAGDAVVAFVRNWAENGPKDKP